MYSFCYFFAFFLIICIFNSAFKIGDKIPSIDLFEDSPANKINTGDLASNKRIIIFGVPGAFTPGCSKASIAKNCVYFYYYVYVIYF